MDFLHLLLVFIFSFLFMPNVIFSLQKNESLLKIGFVHSIFFAIINVIMYILFFENREGFSHDLPFVTSVQGRLDYCMEKNSPPYMGSLEDTENHCSNLLSRTPFRLKSKSKKRVSFSPCAAD